MLLKSKIILGVILGVLWVGLCTMLALIPEQVPVEFKYANKITTNETYIFSMKDYNAVIEKVIKEDDQITEIVFEGIISQKENGGVITFSQGTKKECALDLDLNVQDIAFLGQTDTTAYKIAQNYMVLYIDGKYVTLAKDSFTNYSQVVGAYGSSLKTYKNPNIDIYVPVNESNLKQILYNNVYAINSNGDSNERFFVSEDDIKNINLNNEPFTPDTVGVYAINVIYGDNESIKINACVYDEDNSPDNNLLQISSNTLIYHKTNKNNVEKFLDEAKIKIKFGREENFTKVNKKMVKGLDTTKYGRQVLTIEYKNTKYRLEVIIDDNNNTVPDSLKTTKYFFVKEKGDESWINETFLTATYLNGNQDTNIPLTHEDVSIQGFNKNSLKKQIVTISYKGQETRVLVVVLNSEQYENYLLTGEID